MVGARALPAFAALALSSAVALGQQPARPDTTTTTLGAVRITAPSMAWKLAEFDARRQRGVGQFLTGDEIEKRKSVWVGTILDEFDGLTVMPTSGAIPVESVVDRRGRCFEILVDGKPTSNDLNVLPNPKKLAAIEVYVGPAKIPDQYKRPDTRWCNAGLILLWLREKP